MRYQYSKYKWHFELMDVCKNDGKIAISLKRKIEILEKIIFPDSLQCVLIVSDKEFCEQYAKIVTFYSENSIQCCYIIPVVGIDKKIKDLCELFHVSERSMLWIIAAHELRHRLQVEGKVPVEREGWEKDAQCIEKIVYEYTSCARRTFQKLKSLITNGCR